MSRSGLDGSYGGYILVFEETSCWFLVVVLAQTVNKYFSSSIPMLASLLSCFADLSHSYWGHVKSQGIFPFEYSSQTRMWKKKLLCPLSICIPLRIYLVIGPSFTCFFFLCVCSWCLGFVLFSLHRLEPALIIMVTFTNWSLACSSCFGFSKQAFSCSFGYTGTHVVEQAGFEFPDSPVSNSWVLGLHALLNSGFQSTSLNYLFAAFLVS